MLDIKSKNWNIKSEDMLQFFLVTVGDSVNLENIEDTYRHIYLFMKEEKIMHFHERIFVNSEDLQQISEKREKIIKTLGLNINNFKATFLVNYDTSNDFIGINIHGIKKSKDSQVLNIYEGETCHGKCWSHKGTKHYMLYPIISSEDNNVEQNITITYENVIKLLNKLGFKFKDVIRTWIYIPEIFENYSYFNNCRNKFYRQNEMFTLKNDEYEELELPASTGIGISNAFNQKSPVMDIYVVKNGTVEFYNGVLQKSAFRYGSAFSRSAIVKYEGYEYLYLSGTAAINRSGDTVHIDSLELQVEKMFNVVRELLTSKAFDLNDCVEATIYVKNGCYREYIKKYIRESDFCTIPYTFCIADICRENLLVEIDGIFCRQLQDK